MLRLEVAVLLVTISSDLPELGVRKEYDPAWLAQRSVRLFVKRSECAKMFGAQSRFADLFY